MNKTYRALPYQHFANKGKLKIIDNLFYFYRQDAQRIFNYIWHKFLRIRTILNQKENLKECKVILSERYKYNIYTYVVYPTYLSFLENAKDYIVGLITKSTLNDNDKLILYILNRRGLWLNPPNELEVSKDNQVITLSVNQEHKKLIKKLFHRYLATHRLPEFKNTPLIGDGKIMEFQKSKKSKHFEYWIRLSTNIKNKPIYIPIKETEYYKLKDGKDTSIFQFVKDDLGNIQLKRIKEINAKENNGDNVLSLDFGLANLFATDKGDLLGRRFYDKVKEYADKIDKLQRNLQRQGIKPKESKRYIKLSFKLKEFVKNEIRRIINKLIRRYNPSIIVVENLKNFIQNVINQFPKTVKRTLIRIGRKEIKNKLNDISQEYGIQVIEINPAYSSQACSNCGYIDRENRKSQSEFECRLCGKRVHADVNASRNILKRFEERVHLHSMKQALSWQVRKFLENLTTKRYKCLWSKARSLLVSNVYFANHSSLTQGIDGYKRNKCLY
ncbi:RNA-guided endonuclease TnpB family protein [Sulfurihydrogenibium sp.]|uniref:RNA-guided endonuclease InsQ/TnpB family protein n=1 Tax=Sulfurihydrogenibium sp. TaxID=2053621 RepID=UPI002626B914|nr:RNA-guided endonuclease TnpB family protein [Sulfurihydrogenibium sp.]